MSSLSVAAEPEVPAAGGIVKCVAYVNGFRDQNLALENICDVLQKPDRFIWIGLHEPDERSGWL